MAAVPNGEKNFTFNGRNFKVFSVYYNGSSTSVFLDQSATSVSVIEPASGGPSLTLGASTDGGNSAPTPDFAKEVTLAAGASTGPGGSVTIVAAHGASVGGTKQG